MSGGHDTSTRFEAQDLYVFEGLTLAEVSARTGIPQRTLERWSADDAWVDRREDYRRTESAIRQNEVDARAKLIKKVVEVADPMAAFAYTGLTGALNKARDLALKERQAATPVATREIATPAEAVAALQDVIQAALGRMLSDPAGVSLAKVKDLQAAMKLAAEMKAEAAGEQGKGNDAGLSDDARSEVRRMLGISE